MMLSITIAKLGETFEREVEALPPESVAYLLRNGYSQRMRDCHASIKRSDYAEEAKFVADVRAAIDEVLRQLDTGDVPGARQARVKSALVRTLEELGLTEAEAIERLRLAA